ncbi:DUF1214 domain-containing protein [Mycolicibacterium lutetiense]|jgi:hypothetical protein|uniref:DUF1214 domain-containing protein n=1 Tax=Mycolicibacterium lutetiense TaxID=1641992 RepID=A0ABS4ZU50_9MYCO|nr:DUF1214 domain-containing protein [Mycolicibacterium lutetiense]MBP2453018.1 hypothetical protein [Mycolicibacterium lutetiense]
MTDKAELSEAFNALLDAVRAIEQKLLTAEPTLSEPDLLDGYRLAFSVLRVSVDAYVWGDRDKPILVDATSPYLKWGGDNADAFYQLAPLNPARTYRVTGNRGDAVYMSMTVYGGPGEGRYSDRIVGTINNRDLEFDEDGNFEFIMSPDPHPGTWLKLDADAEFALTRNYMNDSATERRPEWRIETVNPPARRSDSAAELARRFRYAKNWLQEQVSFLPTKVEPANQLHPPFPVPQNAYGWSAGDAAYAMGSYDLTSDQALIIEGTSPECVFWNLCLWNPFLHTFDYTHERVTINGAHVTYESDGSWRIVVSEKDPGHPNWVSTAGRSTGLMWLRWFLPEETPAQPQCRVVHVAEVGAL